MNDSLQKPVTYSLGFHAAVFFLLFVKMAFFPSAPIEIKRSIRVDLVALPDKVQEPTPVAAVEEPAPVSVPAPPPAKPEAPKVAEKSIEKPTVTKTPPKKENKDVKRSQNSALNKLKAMSALEKIKQEKAQQVVKGNQASKGNSLTGLEQIEYDRYFDQVEMTIRSHWSIPQWLSEGEYRAQALVLIDDKGLVIKKEVIKSSGNDIFDSRVLAAVDDSSPFPAPPDRLKDILANRGIVFNFPE